MTISSTMAQNLNSVDYLALRCGAVFSGVAAIAAFTLLLPSFALAWGTDSRAMADEIAEMLAIKPGSTVAEIGAANGAMAVRMAKKVGPAGHVFATEIDHARI